MIKKILASLLIIQTTYANTYVDVPCEDLFKAEAYLKGFSQLCAIEPNEHFVDITILGYTGSVLIDYEDHEDINATVDTQNNLNTIIVPNKIFTIKANNFTSYRLKLYMSPTTGATSLKYFYTGTSRWRNFTEDLIYMEDIVVIPDPDPDENITEPEPILKKIVGNRIIVGGNWNDRVDGDPYNNEKVKLESDTWTLESETDNNGIFTFEVTQIDEFALAANDPIANKWSYYKNNFKVDIDGKLYEKRYNGWTEIADMNESKILNLITLGSYSDDINTGTITQIEENSFSWTLVEPLKINSGIKFTATTEPGSTYTFGFKTTNSFNIWITDIDTNNKTTPILISYFDNTIVQKKIEAIGTKTQIYLAPQITGSILVENVYLVKD